MLSRLIQFIIIYCLSIGLLWTAKYAMRLSDYLIPAPIDLLRAARDDGPNYLMASLDTLLVAIEGHFAAILLAGTVGFVGSLRSTIGAVTKTAAYNLQAYPIVAVSPIIFIFLGDGLASRLLIAALICYFPLLLSLLGIFSQPVEDVEHFFNETGRMNWKLRLGIRIFENIEKLITVLVGSGTMAMVGTIVAEFLAATHGIGYEIKKALYQDNLADILLALFLIGLCSSMYLSVIETIGAVITAKVQGDTG
ncbi:MAG: ABC transporter permease [Dissulfurimicrobium sp.]|uniref:ABC transporter permease n=1 Tax=Dissulfurimicrobium TaxID=1769732 RepID=UPI001EDB8AB5|nr:ABC transporter permease [Dissulfurimicrobium hydrothermale]UKL14609.1 ABC transporter permease [Dissulfurimicrobium hydrothermale]